MPRPFSSTNSGIPLKPILDPLSRSDVSIGQSPCDLLPTTPKPSVGLLLRDEDGAHAPATVLAGNSSMSLAGRIINGDGPYRGWELILGYHSSMPRNLCGLQVGRQSWTHNCFRTKGLPQNSFRILSPCILLPSHAVFGQV